LAERDVLGQFGGSSGGSVRPVLERPDVKADRIVIAQTAEALNRMRGSGASPRRGLLGERRLIPCRESGQEGGGWMPTRHAVLRGLRCAWTGFGYTASDIDASMSGLQDLKHLF